MEVAKTAILLVVLTLLFVWIGGLIGGTTGMMIAFLIALGMNFYSYFNSDKLVLKHYNAVEVDRESARGLYQIVERLTKKANIPMPKVYIIPDHIPNAFATGRNPENAAIAVTEGLLELLDEHEVEAVIAHELAHVKHYDILISTVAATIAGAIAMIANFGTFMGSSNSENRPNPIIMIILMILAPLAASIVQMSVSRSREYMADEKAARLTNHPEWLQSALAKLEAYNKQGLIHNAQPESAHMFIINPFTGKNFSFKTLFSTHPSTQDRIERLEELKLDIKLQQ